MRVAILIVAVAGTAHAAPATVDSALCQRLDDRFDGEHKTYLSVVRARSTSKVTVDEGRVTVCTGAVKPRCATFASADPDRAYDFVVNADGTAMLAPSATGLVIESAIDGKIQHRLVNQQDKGHSCGSGLWLGDTILALGANCAEFDALPYLVARKTGKFIAPLAGKQLTANAETLYDVAHLAGTLWAVAVFDHEVADAFGTVFVIDVASGAVHATVTGAAGGHGSFDDRTHQRDLGSIPACAP